MAQRKATQLKVLQGTARKDREKNKPQIPIYEGGPPEWLQGEALDFWLAYAPILKEKGILTVLDVSTFAILCSSYAMMQQARKEIEKYGISVEGARGNKKKNPAITALNQAQNQFRKLCSEFYLAPDSRSKADLPEVETDKISVEAILNGGLNQEETPEIKKHYTVKQVANKFDVTPRTVRNWINEGKIKAIKKNRKWIIEEAAVNNLKE